VAAITPAFMAIGGFDDCLAQPDAAAPTPPAALTRTTCCSALLPRSFVGGQPGTNGFPQCGLPFGLALSLGPLLTWPLGLVVFLAESNPPILTDGSMGWRQAAWRVFRWLRGAVECCAGPSAIRPWPGFCAAMAGTSGWGFPWHITAPARMFMVTLAPRRWGRP